MSNDAFPKWAEPATKGDLILALTKVRACIVDIYIALLYSEAGNKEKLKEYIGKLNKDDDDLYKIVYTIGGGKAGVEEAGDE